MAKKSKSIDQVVNAALKLAAKRPWREIRLNDIAQECGLTLAELNALGASKTRILKQFARRTDQALLKSLESDPVEGDVHDRLFDILMRRMEMLEEHKAAIASILKAPADGAPDMAMLFGSLAENQGWILAAAGIDDAGPREAVKRHGLALVSARVMRVWVDDDDAGLARTMAALDRQLRDGAVWLTRLQAPIAMCNAFGNLAKTILERRTAGKKADPAPAAEADKN